MPASAVTATLMGRGWMGSSWSVQEADCRSLRDGEGRRRGEEAEAAEAAEAATGAAAAAVFLVFLV